MSEKTESKNKALVLKVFDTLFITFAAKAILLRSRRSKMAPDDKFYRAKITQPSRAWEYGSAQESTPLYGGAAEVCCGA